MSNHTIANELLLKRFWVFDPPPELFKQFEFADLARLAVIQLNAQHAALKAQEEAIEEAREIFARYIKKG
jgi:hypothetical protein